MTTSASIISGFSKNHLTKKINNYFNDQIEKKNEKSDDGTIVQNRDEILKTTKHTRRDTQRNRQIQ